MKFNKKNIFIFGSILIASIFLVSAFVSQSSAQVLAPIPFGGRIATIDYCGEGVMFSLTPEKEISSPAHPGTLPNSFLMPWTNMPPQPLIGLGLYQSWAILPGNGVVGDAIPGGDCSGTPVLFTVLKMGTTLIPGP